MHESYRSGYHSCRVRLAFAHQVAKFNEGGGCVAKHIQCIRVFCHCQADLIGGLQVTFMGIVKPGDNIEVGSETGVVQDVGWRHTTIRDTLGQTVIIPNSIISTTALVHLLPANRVAVPFAIPRHYLDEALTGASEWAPATDPIDALADSIIAHAREAAGGVSPIIDGPRVFFSEITELGVKGKVIFQIKDATKTSLAADAVVRAIARDLG